MAEKNDGADKTEQPTPKRLQDARKKGDVAKSKDVGATAVLVGWLVLAAVLTGFVGDRLTNLFDVAFTAMGQPFGQGFENAGASAAVTFVVISLALMLPVAIFGTLIEFLQVGPVFTFEKMSFKLDHMNPAEGIKRMFNTDNLFEVVKSVMKTALLVLITCIVVVSEFNTLAKLPAAGPDAALQAISASTRRLVVLTVIVFVLVSVLDFAYQRFAFTKKMRMSRRDIKQEHKDSEGDPHVKGQRRQLHQEWAQQNAVGAARDASVLVVNPTHIAVALDYDPARHAVPVVSAKGDGLMAKAMREAAQEAGVPIVRNVELARAMHERVPVESIVPEDMFTAVAEVILWAKRVREDAAAEAAKTEAELAARPGPSFPAPPEGSRL